MELRDPGCQKCQRSTIGDCGDHGPRRFEMSVGSVPWKKAAEEQEAPEPAPPLPIAEPTTPLFHFVCSMNGDHVVYVKIGPGLPPEPSICPWKCGWMKLVGERAARGL